LEKGNTRGSNRDGRKTWREVKALAIRGNNGEASKEPYVR
jgi:hypothetical protein